MSLCFATSTGSTATVNSGVQRKGRGGWRERKEERGGREEGRGREEGGKRKEERGERREGRRKEKGIEKEEGDEQGNTSKVFNSQSDRFHFLSLQLI